MRFFAFLTKPPRPPEPTIGELANSMSDRKGVHWVIESAKLAGQPLTAEDESALAAARAWLADPASDTAAAAGKAAMKSGHKSPAGWAAQAAAWAGGPKPAAPLVLADTILPVGGSLAPLAVAGAVGLAAAVKAGVPLPAPATGPAPLPPVEGPPTNVPVGPAAPPIAMPTPAASPPATTVSVAPPDPIKAQKPFIALGRRIAADPAVPRSPRI